MLGKATAMASALILICSLQQARAAAPADLKTNRIKISYVKPTNPAHQQIYELLQERRVLERFQGYLSPLRLPRTLFVKTAGCDGDSNAWYENTDNTVTVCYEYIDEVLHNAPETTTEKGVTRQDAIIGPTIEVFLHEIGHAIFDLLGVPILGREEDAADQTADYMILHLDQDLARQTVTGVAFMYAHEAKEQSKGLEQFADVHGVPAQRFYNLLCMAYGEDPKLFADLVEKKYLPKSRAEGCADEYKQVDYAVKKLIHRYIDQAQVKKVQPKKLLRPVQN